MEVEVMKVWVDVIDGFVFVGVVCCLFDFEVWVVVE